MFRIIAKAALLGVAGLVAVPVVVFFGVLILGYAFDPRCGTPGDSGGCEMGAATSAIASVIPGFMLFFFVSLLLSLRRKKREDQPPQEPS